MPKAKKVSKEEKISKPTAEKNAEEVTGESKEKPASKTATFYAGFGRRKTATATARLYLPEKEVIINGQKLSRGDIYVNGLPIDRYFNSPYAKAAYTEVLRTTNTLGRFIITVIAVGSGKTGQLGAAVLAIARALVKVDPKFKTTLRKKGFMTRDPRAKERKKPGLMGARKEKQSPKR